MAVMMEPAVVRPIYFGHVIIFNHHISVKTSTRRSRNPNSHLLDQISLVQARTVCGQDAVGLSRTESAFGFRSIRVMNEF